MTNLELTKTLHNSPSWASYGMSIVSILKKMLGYNYRQVSNISRTLEGNKIVDHSDVVGASPVGAAPTTSSFSTWHLASMGWAKATAWWDENDLSFDCGCVLY